MRAWIVLADTGTTDPVTGKVNLLGAGWSITGVSQNGLTAPCAVAAFIVAPWDQCNRPVPLVLELVDEDGAAVAAPIGPDEQGAVRIDATQVIVPPTGAPNGSDGYGSLLINLPTGLPLTPGRHYTWRLSINGEQDELWRASFFVRRAETMPTFGGS